MTYSIPVVSSRFAKKAFSRVILRRGFYSIRQPHCTQHPLNNLSGSKTSFQQIRMSSQWKSSVTWGHNSAQTEEKRNEIIKLAKSVAEFEQKQNDSGFYVVLAHKEGQTEQSQNTRLEIILNHEGQEYLEKIHRASDAYKELQQACEQKELLYKPASTMSFIPKAGYIYHDKPSDVPLNKQFIWIAKLDSHEGKFEEFMDAISTHAGNVGRTEEGTLSFLALQSSDKENSVTLFERYISEEYFKETHSTSESMQEFRSKIQPLLAERVTSGFNPVAGFVDKRETLA